METLKTGDLYNLDPELLAQACHLVLIQSPTQNVVVHLQLLQEAEGTFDSG